MIKLQCGVKRFLTVKLIDATNKSCFVKSLRVVAKTMARTLDAGLGFQKGFWIEEHLKVMYFQSKIDHSIPARFFQC